MSLSVVPTTPLPESLPKKSEPEVETIKFRIGGWDDDKLFRFVPDETIRTSILERSQRLFSVSKRDWHREREGIKNITDLAPLVVELLAAQANVLRTLERWGHSSESPMFFAMQTTIAELLMNHWLHGNRLDPRKSINLEAIFVPNKHSGNLEKVVLRTSDQGRGFKTSSVADCTAEENLEIPSGRGVLLAQNFSKLKYLDNNRRCSAIFRVPTTL